MITYKRILNPEFQLESCSNNNIYDDLRLRNHIWVNSVRSGLLGLIEILGLKEGDNVLVPPFLPHGIFLPLKKKKLSILYYNLDKYLRPQEDSVKNLINRKTIKLIFIIHYFGVFRDYHLISKYSKEKNIIVLEDCAHTLYLNYQHSKFGKLSDVTFFSLNKILSVPEGGLFISNNNNIDLNNLKTKRNVLSKISFYMSYLNLQCFTYYIFVKNYPLKVMSLLFSKIFYYFYYFTLCSNNSCSPISIKSLELIKTLNYEKIFLKRLKIKNIFINEFSDYLTDNVSTDDYITGIAFYYDNGNQISNKLNKSGIKTLRYKKLWWFVPKKEIKNYDFEKKFYDNHFLIPVNENLNTGDVKKIIRTLKKVLNEFAN